MRAVGMILWAVRHCFPEGKYGASQLCSMMLCPSDAAFDAAMHMIAYMEQHKTKGVLFSAVGNVVPVMMSDASNKPDPADGLAHAGHTAHWANGPITAKSSKLKHEGLSSEHEYMGLTAALRFCVWMRQMLSEIGLSKITRRSSHLRSTATTYRRTIYARITLYRQAISIFSCLTIGTGGQ